MWGSEDECARAAPRRAMSANSGDGGNDNGAKPFRQAIAMLRATEKPAMDRREHDDSDGVCAFQGPTLLRMFIAFLRPVERSVGPEPRRSVSVGTNIVMRQQTVDCQKMDNCYT